MSWDDDDTVDELPAAPRKVIDPADLELLTLAARALGATFDEVDGEGYGNLHFEDGSVQHAWNPLLFYGDTFELAFRLEMKLKFYANGAAVIYMKDGGIPELQEYGDSGVEAACRAVTRAAAEIGKQRS